MLLYLITHWQCGLKFIGKNFQTVQGRDLILLLENVLRGGISSLMGDQYVKSDEKEKTMYIDAKNKFKRSMSPLLPYDEIIHDKTVS